MKDLADLKAKLQVAAGKKDAFQATIDLIVKYYVKAMGVTDKEVALLLANKKQTILSFAAPGYLVNSGIIPVSSNEALASSIFNTGNPLIDNTFHLRKHLSIFELVKTPSEEILPIWKIIAVRIGDEKDRIGVIEISRRSTVKEKAGANFTTKDLQTLETTIRELAPFIRKVMPEDFQSQLS